MENKELTQEQKEFLDKTLAHRKDKVEELAAKALAISISKDIPVYDLPYYVLQRARQIIQDAFTATTLKNEKLIEARKNFLKKYLAELNKNVKTLDPLPADHVKDETELRDERCEPISQELVKMLLDPELVFSDDNYFNATIADEEKVPLNAAIAGYATMLDDKLVMIISQHYRRSTEKMWGVDRDSITFSMMDEVLKRP